jgi:hypothetical protein
MMGVVAPCHEGAALFFDDVAHGLKPMERGNFKGHFQAVDGERCSVESRDHDARQGRWPRNAPERKPPALGADVERL